MLKSDLYLSFAIAVVIQMAFNVGLQKEKFLFWTNSEDLEDQHSKFKMTAQQNIKTPFNRLCVMKIDIIC